MKERIKQLRKALSLTQSDFATSLHVTRSTVGIWETIDDRPPSSVTVALICEIYNVNRRWLETGEGEMFNPLSHVQKISNFMNDVARTDRSQSWQLSRQIIVEALAEMPPEFWEQAGNLIKEIREKSEQ